MGSIIDAGNFQDVWIKIRKLNPKWCEWQVFDETTYDFQLLVGVDCQHNFQYFYETYRVKVSCKDYARIPKERVFGINGELYRVLIDVEHLCTSIMANEPSIPPPIERQKSMETKKYFEDNTEYNKSHRSSRTRSKHGSLSGSKSNVNTR